MVRPSLLVQRLRCCRLLLLAVAAVVTVPLACGFTCRLHPSISQPPVRCGSSQFLGSRLFSSSTSSNVVDCLQKAVDRMQLLQKQAKLPRLQIRVGPSSIPNAGQGVFATKNIKAGTIIGFYPVHMIGMETYDDSDNEMTVTSNADDRHFFENTADDADNNYLQYLVGSRPLCGLRASEMGATFYIDVNPEKNSAQPDASSSSWISHFINDFATVTSNSEDGLVEYYQKSAAQRNCVHTPFGPSPMIVTMTTTKVKKNDELFTTYGGSYWLASVLKEGEEEVEITEAIQLQAKLTAQSMLDAVKKAQVTYVSLQDELERMFSIAE